MERLNKVLARAGLASRRGADRLIEEGRVTVNGRVVRELGGQVDPVRDAIKVDGRRIPPAPTQHAYFVLYKPRGYVTTMSDPQSRPTVRELIRAIRHRVFPVGRLDFDSEGLLLLTDDGELARDLMHPGSGVLKTYAVKVRGEPGERALARLRAGVELREGPALPARARVTRRGPNSWLEISVVEGRKHQVRRMLEAVGHPVLKLKRIRYAGLTLRGLQPGGLRRLGADEIDKLRRAARPGRRNEGGDTRPGVS
jgi:23S rRNA pseudouridine2605 synthase/16S rRNA pseudouridine516 synthase